VINIINLPGGFDLSRLQQETTEKIVPEMGVPPKILEKKESLKTKTDIIRDWLSSQDSSISGNKLAAKLKQDKDIIVSGAYINKLKKA